MRDAFGDEFKDEDVDGDEESPDEEDDELALDDEDDTDDDDDLDDDEEEDDEDVDGFPRGDGTADGGALVSCPYCGEGVEIALDPGGGTRQRYVEDCEVCCRPWRVTVTYGRDGSASVDLQTMDGD